MHKGFKRSLFERKSMKKETIIQFIKFGFVGGINTVLSYAIYYVLCIILGLNYLLSQGIAWFITVFISYVLNNIMTFSDGGSTNWSIKNLVKVYISYSVTGLFLATFLSWIWVDVLSVEKVFAPIINLFFTIPLNFLLNKYWAYAKH